MFLPIPGQETCTSGQAHCKQVHSSLVRWALKLQDFAFTPEYIRGEDSAADGLSRPIRAVRNEASNLTIPSVAHRNDILKEYYLISGHGSSATLKFLISSKYSWPGMTRDIEFFCTNRLTCQRAQGPRINAKNRVISVEGPNQLWTCDILGRLPTTGSRKKFILVAIDSFTKWIESKAIPSKDAESVARALDEIIIRKHGTPERILSDSGCEFNNSLCKGLAVEHGFTWEFSSPGYHEITGAAERAIQTLFQKIRRLANLSPRCWDKVLSKATYATDISPSCSTGASPFILKTFKDPLIPIDSITKAHC
ncbi:hypothetical protein PAPHI01_2495 [Pancytospora philotis]|nr:hypothetical protein PAPHI01_2495 [Pancytospora philotis]